METRIYMSIWEPPWRPVWCLFLVWCNIKSSLNDRCCWQSGSKRTNHAKKKEKKKKSQCSCRFKETKLDEWLRGNERQWKNKRQGNQSKNGRGGGTLGAGGGGKKEHKDGTESAWGQEGENKNRWYPSTSSNLYATKWVEMKTSLCFWRFQQEGEERLFPTWLSWAGSLNQACMDGGDPLCLPRPSRSADPGAGKGKGCTTWKL